MAGVYLLCRLRYYDAAEVERGTRSPADPHHEEIRGRKGDDYNCAGNYLNKLSHSNHAGVVMMFGTFLADVAAISDRNVDNNGSRRKGYFFRARGCLY